MRRSPLRRVGAVAKRYAKVRQAFLKVRWAGGKEGWSEKSRLVPCDCGCGAQIEISWSENDWYACNGHVDHIKKRSTHPELREDVSNLRLLTPACHMRRHLT